MIKFEVTDDDDIILLFMHASSGAWVEKIQPMRCPHHSEGVDLNIAGKPKDDEDGVFSVTAVIAGCCQEFIDSTIEANRQL